MKKILVTGGAGFIGSHVVDLCLDAGLEVVVVDDLSAGSRENLNPRAAFCEVDIRSDELAEVFAREKPHFVSHHAAQIDVRRSVEEPLFDAQVNILGSVNVLQNCVDHGVEKFLFASTGGAIYGNVDEYPISEAVEPKPVCHYGVSKRSVEHYIFLYHALYGLRYTILRYPNVYGPRQSPHGEAGVCAIFTGLMLEGKPPILYGHGSAVRDYVYVGDIARGTILSLDKGDGETMNLGSRKGTTVRELFDIVKEYTGFEGEPILEPLRPGEVDTNYITGDLAKDVLGWEPKVDIRQGLKNLVEHVRRSGK
jgi:UDP-glucose 4-epimerase